MSLGLIDSTGAGSGPRSRVILPISTGLQMLNYIGIDAANSVKNRAVRASTPSTIVGTPSYAADRATLSAANYLKHTELAEPLSFTRLFVWRGTVVPSSATTNRCAPVGFGSNTKCYVNDVGTFRFATTIGGSIVTSTMNRTATEMQTIRMMAWVVEAGVGQRLYDLTAADSVVTANAGSRVDSGLTLITGGAQGTFTAPVEMSLDVLHNVALTKAQIDLNAAQLARFLKDVRGITGLVPGV